MDNVKKISHTESRVSNKLAKLVRVATIPSVAACAALCVIYAYDSTLIGSFVNFLLAILFLGILPMLAYPLQPFIPHFKDKGREGQRNLAMVFAFLGYVLGCTVNIFMSKIQILRKDFQHIYFLMKQEEGMRFLLDLDTQNIYKFHLHLFSTQAFHYC